MSIIWKHLIKSPKQTFYIQIRNSRSKPFIPIIKKIYQPTLYYSLEERLSEKDEKKKDPELYSKVNIGFAVSEERETIKRWKYIRNLKDNVPLEKQARECTLKLDLDVVEKDWINTDKPKHLKALADNYSIFNHLFGDYAYFYPVVNMEVLYDFDEDTVSPVHAGNLLKPKEAATRPTVKIEGEENDLWTLYLTNPDGNLYDNESEMLHWFVGNISGGDVSKGQEIVDYLRPIPPKGSGFHRYCFLLFKQTQKIDFSQYERKTPCINLKERTFKTFEFYKTFEDVLTPAGLSWFQADYDTSLTQFFHKTLIMKEPIYEYDFPKPFVKPQRQYPHKAAFNSYMDLHRDPKEIQKMMLLKRLSRVHPLQGEKPLLPFPQAVPIDTELAIWQKNEIQRARDGRGRYRDMYRGDDRPFIKEGRHKYLPFTKL